MVCCDVRAEKLFTTFHDHYAPTYTLLSFLIFNLHGSLAHTFTIFK
jgi:hypothetical protein